MEDCRYIEVIVPLRLSWTPCYRCRVQLRPGQRVTVPVTGRRYVGVVHRTDILPDIDPSRIQEISAVNDELPAVSEEELRFWEFLSSYYLCSIGEVYKAAYPSGKIRSEQTAAGILERLRQRLAIREEALTRKHRDNVRERLEQERDAIGAQIVALTLIPDSAEAVKPSPGKPLLLTGPGRISRYVSLCRETVGKGLNVLVLLPEIAASEQLQAVFEEHFPGVTHKVNSHMTDARRRAVAEDVRHFGGQIVTGTRSALFLPLSRLGLVIVEQEQDPYFKQTDPAPRYHARDAAVVLARIHGAQVVLGTPAPSLESLHNALTGKYIREDLPQNLPTPVLIDVNAERRKNGMPGRLSRKLLEAASRTSGPVALIRGWEKQEELAEEAATWLPDRQVDILTPSEARLKDLGAYGLVAVVQADALMNADDFRADEHALQALAQLRENVRGAFIVQTAKTDHPVYGAPESVYAQLLEERRQFRLPPYTRLVDTVCGSRRERITLAADGTLAARKQEILERAKQLERTSRGRLRTIIDVDPL
ncbi:MAG: hypothetical protein J5737_07985 [Bacteroidales bacterium]|nr:hypothetical protein [Bacteroidales bacterium]